MATTDHLPKLDTDPITAARKVVETHTAHIVNGVLLDQFTAGAIVAVADALSQANREKLRALSVEKAGVIALKLVGTQS